MKVNVDLLDSTIDKSGMSKDTFAKMLGMDASTYYRKRKTYFEKLTVGQMHTAVEQLNMTPELAKEIFLPNNSQ